MEAQMSPSWAEEIYREQNWRSCFRVDGTPKVRMTRSEAKRMRDDLRRRGDRVGIYRCSLGCGAWHVGHSEERS